ncbi:MAG: PEP-CTERM sorting domain-containing protein, partial [Tepidisphaeraceae bacterium]
ISETNWVAGVGKFDPDGLGSLTPYDRAYLLDVSSLVPEPTAMALLAIAAVGWLRGRRPRN